MSLGATVHCKFVLVLQLNVQHQVYNCMIFLSMDHIYFEFLDKIAYVINNDIIYATWIDSQTSRCTASRMMERQTLSLTNSVTDTSEQWCVNDCCRCCIL